MGSHYDEYYEERDIRDRAYHLKQLEEKVSLKQLEEKVSEIQKEITEQFPLAACRANKSNEVAIVNLLNEIVKELHK